MLIDFDEFMTRLDDVGADVIEDNGDLYAYFGFSRERLREVAEKAKIDAIPVEEVMRLFGDETPCNFNGWDEYADCEYCEKNCDNHDTLECWKHAIREKWYNKG